MSQHSQERQLDCGGLHPKSIAQMLQVRGIAPTPQRLKVGELMLGATQHLTAEQVIENLRLRGTPVSKATVYSTLKLFAATGLLRRINIDADRMCFDSNMGMHYHFHNTDTGELTDVELKDVQFQKLPEPPPGTELAGVDIVLRVRHRT